MRVFKSEPCGQHCPDDPRGYQDRQSYLRSGKRRSGGGIADAETRIAQNFTFTGGENYEIVNLYANDMTGNTNSFIAQYCAAKGESWDIISLADMQAILRQGKSSLYSYTRTSGTRTVKDDDPDTEDVVEAKEETWYIYTLLQQEELLLRFGVPPDERSEIAGGVLCPEAQLIPG